MILQNFNYLDKEYIEKFLKICLLLFPQYKSASIKKDGTVIFITHTSFFKRVRIPFIRLIEHDIIMKLSILRWNSKDLASRYFNSLMELKERSKNTKNPTVAEQLRYTREIIDFLYSNFLTTNLKDLYNNYCTKILNSDYIAIKDDDLESSFFTVVRGNVKTLGNLSTYVDLSQKVQRQVIVSTFIVIIGVASFIYSMFNLPSKLDISSIYHGVISQYPWKIM